MNSDASIGTNAASIGTIDECTACECGVEASFPTYLFVFSSELCNLTTSLCTVPGHQIKYAFLE